MLFRARPHLTGCLGRLQEISSRPSPGTRDAGRFSGVFYGWWLVGISGFVMVLSTVPLFHAMSVCAVARERQFGCNRPHLVLALPLPLVLAVRCAPLDAPTKDASAFLAGWDYRYDRGSIAASLFEGWMTEYRNKVGRLPTTAPDSATAVILQQTLRDAVERLQSGHTERASAWRWELIQPGTRYFPVWSDTSRGAPPSRYAPLTPGLGGHPTALFSGPSLVFGDAPAPAVWTAWTITSNWNRTHIYHPVARTNGFLARELGQREAVPIYTVRRDAEMPSPLYLRPRE